MKRILVPVLAAILLLSCLSGCFSNAEQPSSAQPSSEAAGESTEPSSETAPSSETEPPVARDAVVTDAIAEEKESENFGSMSFHVPQVNLAGAEAVNAEIMEDFGKLAQQALQAAADSYPECFKIDWELHWYNDTFALVICKHLGNDYNSYKVYSFDYPDGTPLEFEELLSRADYTAEEYYAQLAARAEQVYRQAWGGLEQADPNGFAEKLAWTVSDENLRSAERRNVYFNETGRLMVIMPIGSLAGAGSYETVFALDEG